jgi:protein-tyrosine phosphatase
MQAQIVQILGSTDYALETQRAAELLSAGKMVVLPTETVYGVAGLLTHSDARNALTQLRGQANAKPFTIHVARPEDALQYLGEVSAFARRAIRKFWPGPIGLVFDVPEATRIQVARNLGLEPADLYDGSSITLRCPDNQVFADVVQRVNQPVALITAGPSAQRVTDLSEEILAQVESVFDAGPTRFSKPSTLLRIHADSCEIVRVGVYDQRIIDRLLRTTVLFVCSGNTCRSPMAEALAKKVLADRMGVEPDDLEKKGLIVLSAGSFAMPGARATPQAVEAIKTLGADLSRHRSRPLSVELIHQADVIYTMGKSHAQVVASLVPGAAEKISNLDPDGDIEDPIGGDLPLYSQVAERIKGLIEQRLERDIAQ